MILHNSKKIIVSLLLVITLVASMGVTTFATDDITPYGVNVSGYVSATDYLSNMIDCLNDGSKWALIVGSIYEKQRNIKIDTEGLAYEKTQIFTSLDAATVRSNYDAVVAKYTPKQEESSQAQEQLVSLGTYKLTFYCSCSKCCGKSNGITASGTKATEGRTIAVDTSKIPLGSKVYIEGWGYYIAEDTGGAINGNILDVYVSSHSKALQYGIKYANVYLVK